MDAGASAGEAVVWMRLQAQAQLAMAEPAGAQHEHDLDQRLVLGAPAAAALVNRLVAQGLRGEQVLARWTSSRVEPGTMSERAVESVMRRAAPASWAAPAR